MRMYYENMHASAARPACRIGAYGLAVRGGHFLAAEEPALLAEDIKGYFRQFRG